MSESVVLVAPIDPRTDPLAQMLWALVHKRQMSVASIHAVVDKRGYFYLEREFLAPGEVLEQLAAAASLPVAGPSQVVIHRATLADGSYAQDEAIESHAQAYLSTLWEACQAAVDEAGERRVIFGLLGVRRRSMSAALSAFFQMLARPDDLLLDVRLSDRRAEIGGDFFFPAQTDPVPYRDLFVDPKTVDINLVEIDLVKLGGLLGKDALGSYSAAIEKSRAAISALSPPRLKLDLVEGRCWVEGESLPLSSAELLWYGFLAQGRASSEEGWVVVGQDGHGALRDFYVSLIERPWATKIRTQPLRALASGDYVADEDLKNLRGKTVQKVKRWCDEHRPAAAEWIVPRSDGGRHQRIPIPRSHLEVTVPKAAHARTP